MAAALYDKIGSSYDLTRRADTFLVQRLHELLGLKAGSKVLDVGCGTGNYTIGLSRKDLLLTGVDPSSKMLQEAAAKAPDIAWCLGHAEHLPFADESHEGVVATLTLHHWNDLRAGIREVYRVLRPGGRFVIFTSTPEQTGRYWLAHYFPSMIKRSAQALPAEQVIKDALLEAGFIAVSRSNYEVRQDLQDLFLYAAKFDPTRYLDPVYRRGISSFTVLADPAELEQGLANLEADIINGSWQAIQERYLHAEGDYLHLVAEKEG